MPKEKSRPRVIGEYAVARTLLGTVRLLPTAVALRLCDWIGELSYLLDRQHREVAQANLAAVFGGSADDPKHRATARQVFRKLSRVGAEFILLPRLIRKRGLEQVVEITGLDHVREAQSHGRGIVIYSAHIGNWEVIAAAGEPLDLRLHTVGRTLDNPLLDRYLMRERERYARAVIPKEGGLPQVVRALRAGDSVAMLLDQHAGRRGIDVDFLGRPASTFRAAAELAVRFRAPMLGGFGIRVDDSPRFRLDFQPILLANEGADREDEVRRLTQAVSDCIAEQVRAYPEQWNWLHRRWREPRKGRRKQGRQQLEKTL